VSLLQELHFLSEVVELLGCLAFDVISLLHLFFLLFKPRQDSAITSFVHREFVLYLLPVVLAGFDGFEELRVLTTASKVGLGVVDPPRFHIRFYLSLIFLH